MRQFIDFMFRGAKKDREEAKRPIVVMRIMAMNSAYYDDLKEQMDDWFATHGFKNVDLNHLDEWPKALPYCMESEVDVVMISADAIRQAVQDGRTRDGVVKMWI